MAPEGMYSIDYQGVAGSGSGMIVLKDGTVAGADPNGGKYDGTYQLDPLTRSLNIKANVTIPPGGVAVNGVAAGNQPITFPVAATIPAGHVGGYAHTVHTPHGNIRVVLTKVRDLP